jgi:dTDP-4-amino-4,6-dideoxygalactose transaminase
LSASVVREGRFPGAERLAVELVTLPAHSLLSTADRSRLSDRIRSYK